jgi:hypothetical protein
MDSTKVCDWCGESYSDAGRRSGDSIYCSDRCYHHHYHDKKRRAKWAATNAACLGCGVEFVTLPTRASGYQKYCSNRCKVDHYKTLIDVRAGDKTEKRCKFCDEVKPLDSFSRSPHCADGHGSKCKECRFARHTELRLQAKEEPRIKREFKRCPRCQQDLPATPMFWHRQRGTPDGLGAFCRPCKSEDSRQYRTKNPEATRRHWQTNNLKARMDVLHYYGGYPPACACCGEAHLEFLAIDHIEGGGVKHRKEVMKNAGNAFYRWLRNHDYPAGYRVLCHSCNCARGFYGYCPHDLERENVVLSPSRLVLTD